MKIKSSCLIFLTFLFLILEAANSQTQSPFVWIVEKEEKVSYLLGVVHIGVSLEEMPCSNEIVNQIQSSDLLFLEYKFGDDTQRLNKEEKRKIFIGSKEEQEEVLSRLSFESQEVIRERKIASDNFFRSAYPFNVQSVTKDAFSELSPKSQEFLMKHGVDPEGSHADFFHFIRFIAYYQAYFSLTSLDEQIEEIAFSQSITIKALDNNKQINEDISSQASSNKPLKPVNYKSIEQLIDEMDILVNRRRRSMQRFAQLYKSYDRDLFEEFLGEEKEGNENIHEEVFSRSRNELWLQKFMEAHARYENIFLAAGLHHFIGIYNLLGMLIEEGFSIKRMTCYQ